MNKLVSFLKKPIARVLLGLVVLLILGGAVAALAMTQTSPDQPIEFPHSTHVGIGAPCLYCHPGAMSGPVAGLPTVSKCWGCHQQIAKTNTSPELQKLVKYVKEDRPIAWVPVAIQPDFVHFNHRPHLSASISCETCHGDVGSMTVARPPFVQNMGWCLECHKTMRPENATLLLDCATCHY